MRSQQTYILIATIESFQVEESDKPTILIKTSQRTLKIACITKDSHEKWVQVN